jgi:O-antigen/teichoic acid export membrane protein
MMGIEAYALVGLFLTIRGLFSVLDLGLTTTLNREFARLSAQAQPEARQRTLLRTVETIYWFIAALIAGLVIAAARPIAEHWVRPEALSVEVIVAAVVMMGVVMLFDWPLTMYSGGLLGLQRHVMLNAVNAVMATLRGIGAILVLWLLDPTLTVFFGWQLVVSILHTAAVAATLWGCIGGVRRAAFDLLVLIPLWRFAAGIVLIGVTSIALMQVDKLMVSKLLPLSELGYYTLAAALALGLYRIISPFFAAVFPRFSQLVAVGDQQGLASLYHRSCETLSVIVLPAAVFLAFFSREVLILWTRDPVLTDETHLVLTILVIGTAMSGLMNLPYAVQLAYGWSRLALTYNVVSVFILFPAAYMLTRRWGIVGASLSWMVYNAVGLLLIPSLMHRRVLRGEQVRLYVRDIGVPLVAALLVGACMRLLLADTNRMPQLQLLVSLLAVAGVMQGAATMAAAGTRSWIWFIVQAVRVR